jgi:hypothetical protein
MANWEVPSAEERVDAPEEERDLDPEPGVPDLITPDEFLQRQAWYRVAEWLQLEVTIDELCDLNTTALARLCAEEIERRSAEELHRDLIEREAYEERAERRRRSIAETATCLTPEEEHRRDSGTDDWPF